MQQAHLGNAVKNNLWTTDEDEHPDPDILPELPGFHVLVRPISIKTKTKGGIILPDSTKDDMAYKDQDKFPFGPWCEEGDYICYGKHTGTKLFYKSVRLILMFDDQVMMKVENPAYLDPTFNLTSFSM